MEGGTLIITILGGMICGALVTGGLLMGYLWVRQPKLRLPPSLRPPKPLSLSTDTDFPPPPERRNEPELEAVATLPPEADNQKYRTFEHRYDDTGGTPWLDGIGGMVAGQRIKISRTETLMGRSRVCDVQLHDPKVSR